MPKGEVGAGARRAKAVTAREPTDGARPKRRRDAGATREAILEAAIRHFATQGYERAGVREIAADVGVNAALVNRYFGSKEGLFAEAVEHAIDMEQMVRGHHGNLAEHLARFLVFGREGAVDEVPTSLLLLLHTATEPRAVEVFRQDLDRAELRILASHIGGEDAVVRAALVLAQLAGFALLYHVLRPEALANAGREELVALLTRGLAACIGGGVADASPHSGPGNKRPRRARPRF